MAKICGNCGAQVDDNAFVCGYCGAALQQEPAQNGSPFNGVPGGAGKKFDLKKLDLKKVLVAVAAVVAVIVVISLLSGGGYKSVVKDYMKAYEECDADKMMDLTTDVLAVAFEEELGDLVDAEELLKEGFEEKIEALEDKFGEDIKITYEITDDEEMDDEDLDEFKEELEELDADIKISKAHKIEIEGTIEGSDDEDDFELKLVVLKENGKWKVLDESLF